MSPLSRIFRLVQFQVGSGDNYAGPTRRASHFVDLQADLGVLPHPFNLLAQRGKDVDAVSFIRKADRYDIRLVVQRTPQPADRNAVQQLAALLPGNWTDSHDAFLPDHAASDRQPV